MRRTDVALRSTTRPTGRVVAVPPAVLTAVAVGLLAAAGTGTALTRALVHRCLATGGPVDALGVRLTVWQDAAQCPEGSLTLSQGLPYGVVLAVSLALPVVAAHVLLGAVGLGLTAVLRCAARTVRRVLAAVLPALPVDAPAVLPALRPQPPAGCLVPLPTGVPGLRHPRRGPPVATVPATDDPEQRAADPCPRSPLGRPRPNVASRLVRLRASSRSRRPVGAAAASA